MVWARMVPAPQARGRRGQPAQVAEVRAQSPRARHLIRKVAVLQPRLQGVPQAPPRRPHQRPAAAGAGEAIPLLVAVAVRERRQLLPPDQEEQRVLPAAARPARTRAEAVRERQACRPLEEEEEEAPQGLRRRALPVRPRAAAVGRPTAVREQTAAPVASRQRAELACPWKMEAVLRRTCRPLPQSCRPLPQASPSLPQACQRLPRACRLAPQACQRLPLVCRLVCRPVVREDLLPQAVRLQQLACPPVERAGRTLLRRACRRARAAQRPASLRQALADRPRLRRAPPVRGPADQQQAVERVRRRQLEPLLAALAVP